MADSTQHVDKNIAILVVDDQSMSRTMVKAALKGMGFENVTMAESGEQAVSLLQSTPMDLVIADWHMPGLTGLDLLKYVRSSDKPNIPFLMLTGERTKESVVTAISAGVSDYLGKPFSPRELGDKLAAIMRRHAAKR